LKSKKALKAWFTFPKWTGPTKTSTHPKLLTLVMLWKLWFWISTKNVVVSPGPETVQNNPWQQFAETHNKGDRVEGKIKSITDFGIFIGLDGGIDGLVHLSDISWNVAGEEAVREYKKGDEIAAVVLQVDAERERISLGVKQLAEDPFNNWVALNKKGAIVNGKVTAVDAKGATVELADGVEGYLRASEASRDRVEDATLVLSVGDDVEAKSPALTARTVQSACLFVLKTKLMRKMQSQLLTSRKMQTSLTTQWLKLSKQLKASNIKFSASF
jgi:small subunit ribosomal protein S1